MSEEVQEQVPQSGYKMDMKVLGTGRLRFLIESIFQLFLVFIGFMMIFGGTLSIGALASTPQVAQEAFAAGGIISILGFVIIISAWIWSFFIWYRRLQNMGFTVTALIIVTLVCYFTGGLLTFFIWLWLLFAGPKPQLTYVKV